MFTTANGNPCDVAPGSKVLRDYIPDWFTERLLETFGPTDLGDSGYCYLHLYGNRECNGFMGWLDHDGSTLIDDVAVFVSEPYYPVEYDYTDVEKFAQHLGCTLLVSDKSYWFPGKTIRLAFMPDDFDLLHGQQTVRFAGISKELTE